MKLLLKRTQRSGGMLGGKIYFALDARIDLTDEEKDLIRKYSLGKLSIYNSEAMQKHLQAAATHAATGNGLAVAKGLVRLGMAALSLRCTIDSLTEGQHIECKDMDELLAAEQAIVTACQNAKEYLETALTFDGREVVLDIGAQAAIV